MKKQVNVIIAAYVVVTAVSCTSGSVSVGKTTLSKEALERQKIIRQEGLDVYVAMRQGSVDDVRRAWKAYRDKWGEGPLFSLRYDLGKYFVKHKLYKEGEEHLRLVLDPPKGTGTTQERDGAPLILWIEAASHVPGTDTNKMLNLWASKQQSNPTARMTPLARAYHLAGRERMAIGSQEPMKEAIVYFKKATELSPESSVAWADLGFAKAFTGDKIGAKQARIQAYNVADSKDKPRLMKTYKLSAADVASAP